MDSRKIPKDSKGFQKIPKDSKDSKRFQKIPKDSKELMSKQYLSLKEPARARKANVSVPSSSP